jgi:hypothetical protein
MRFIPKFSLKLQRKFLFRSFRGSYVRFAKQLHIRAVSGYYCSLHEVMMKLNLPVHWACSPAVRWHLDLSWASWAGSFFRCVDMTAVVSPGASCRRIPWTPLLAPIGLCIILEFASFPCFREFRKQQVDVNFTGSYLKINKWACVCSVLCLHFGLSVWEISLTHWLPVTVQFSYYIIPHTVLVRPYVCQIPYLASYSCLLVITTVPHVRPN